MRELSLHVVGADHPNRGRGNRRFEILLCLPGEAVALVPEPRNPVDPHAVMVVSVRGVQIGYLTADRAAWIGAMLRGGREVAAVFQQATPMGAAIRVAFDGAVPVLPQAVEAEADPEPEFWPDEVPPEDWE
ncbi:HIRAN domain-containing protein [Sphingomonas sp. 2R-10]|uniref:HIRAN domain-containing protein n=1 Tax=Sphingomonas sp. 2R-10 TaxID=3045148 RepID=UPI000F7B02C6|nr:HIRAN domain-containing protein [Sphingomonas sp. 2R-10]MDJ0278452.1 HIRAN domain-containing protein [Sphingomonas sp. 2R-10]